MRFLNAFLNGQLVGRISEGNDLWTFEYDAAWAAGPDSFDLAPGLPRQGSAEGQPGLIRDGGSLRPVQWYFDNLLPEGALREAVIKEAGLKGDDAFALLAWLGAESAGSLVLLPPGAQAPTEGELQALADEALSGRIRNMARVSLSSGAPKRMSVAGAQPKLLVVYRNGQLFEPVGAEPSTHILKPNHPGEDYPSSVINEYLVVKLAGKVGLAPPAVYRRYVPEPVYIIERFDRKQDARGRTQRRHIIDACQLLNKSRNFKNTSASLKTLAQCIELCRNRAAARLGIYRWLMFNVLVGNDDNHLKNISFRVSTEGVELSPPYDMLCTAAYHTTAMAGDRANWPALDLMIALPGAAKFGEVTRDSFIKAGAELGIPEQVCLRELSSMRARLPDALKNLQDEIAADNAQLLEAAKPYLAGERRLIRVIESIVLPFMLERSAM